eukprot:3865688-Prymnesium_polylepis.1
MQPLHTPPVLEQARHALHRVLAQLRRGHRVVASRARRQLLRHQAEPLRHERGACEPVSHQVQEASTVQLSMHAAQRAVHRHDGHSSGPQRTKLCVGRTRSSQKGPAHHSRTGTSELSQAS